VFLISRTLLKLIDVHDACDIHDAGDVHDACDIHDPGDVYDALDNHDVRDPVMSMYVMFMMSWYMIDDCDVSVMTLMSMVS
jgi:hypothetical protein